MFEYYEVLAEVEEALEEVDRLQIQLVPSELETPLAASDAA